MHVTIVPTSQASGQVLPSTPPLHFPQMLFPAAPTPPPKASANGPLRPDPPSASADPDSKSKEPHSKGGNVPTSSAGQVDNALKGGNAGDNLNQHQPQSNSEISIQQINMRILRTFHQPVFHLKAQTTLQQPVAAAMTTTAQHQA